ncbi:DNA double-strand break repair nuclease NurA [Methanobrevibacter sp. TMH8]|uniref:DNA double-strand break repair nuclease NurA n=1 Tax=Methanobrevibacter sp. TMH8 TaxID=2848611 RepID=UPI001CCE7126|nr:DNA double-strand break repair nuclease NurA [Methanobrevibacter sp. TMH8]MBZ9570520.1 DNA double-strand break repair nuclease NurA [Methanobrevibacter sp. TMH8]
MLESLYSVAIKKKGTIVEEIENYEDKDFPISKFWKDEEVPKYEDSLTIAAGDGSKHEKKFLSFYFYAIAAETLIYNNELVKIESSDINTMLHGKFSKDRIRNYMGLFEVKNALKAIKTHDIDYYLYDGSLLGDLIRPYPLEKQIPQDIRFDVLDFAEDELNKEINNIENHEVEIYSSKLVKNDLKTKLDDIKAKNGFSYIENIENYLENIEKLLALANLLKYKDKIIAISKSSIATDYFDNFDTNIPDIAIFTKYTQDTGYSFPPRYLSAETDQFKREFPIENDFFKSLNFTIFYVRLEDNKNVLKIELPYKADEAKIKEIISVISRDCTEGYPYLLKKAHHDVVIKKKNIEQLSNIVGIYEKSGREML